MKVLVINCGSSSVKYSLFDMEDESVLAKGIVERVGLDNSMLKHKAVNGRSCEREVVALNHSQALKAALEVLVDSEFGVLEDLGQIKAVGHRVVHGGEKFSGSVVIDEEVVKAIEDFSQLAPLHNPPNLLGIKACKELLPHAIQVAVFDTAFHQTLSPQAYMYALPFELYENERIRRYGFHGTSHKYVALKTAEVLGKPIEELKIITCHLGNGCSITAVKGGKSIETSMGFTPLEGLVMGTRSGDIDPAVVVYLMEKGMDEEEIYKLLNNKSGLLGVSGVSSDWRDVKEAALQGNERARLAAEIFIHRVKKYIGAYAAILGGLDAITFTAGIGENDPWVRERICEGLEFLGVKIDRRLNEEGSGARVVSASDARVAVLVVPTNEELMIARDTLELAGSKAGV